MLGAFLIGLLLLPLPRQGSEPCSTKPNAVKVGAEWLAISSATRMWWVEGFTDGQSHSFLAWEAETKPSAAKREEMRQQLFPMYGPDVLADVMTSIYEDPANTFISRTAMLYVAKAKLSGKDIEGMLRHSRQVDCVFSK